MTGCHRGDAEASGFQGRGLQAPVRPLAEVRPPVARNRCAEINVANPAAIVQGTPRRTIRSAASCPTLAHGPRQCGRGTLRLAPRPGPAPRSTLALALTACALYAAVEIFSNYAHMCGHSDAGNEAGTPRAAHLWPASSRSLAIGATASRHYFAAMPRPHPINHTRALGKPRLYT